jgi:serine/threonine protein kinase/predicted Zn-dependent protease
MASYCSGNDSSSHPDIPIGKLILHYRVDSRLGSGGMGEVYLAEDSKLKRRVALKFLPHRLREDATASEYLLNEARAASKVNHPNLVSIYSIEKTDDRYFIVMEYVVGKTLRQIIDESDLPTDKKINIALQIAAGLKAAHDHDIVHLDIKPDNIIVTSDNQVKILDFGLALFKDSIKLAKPDKITGTLAYSSPEQVQNQAIDKRSDIFSLGVVLYELFEGDLPFKGDYGAALIYSIVNEDPPPLKKGISKDIKEIINRALEKNPDRRYQDLSELLTNLEHLTNLTISKVDINARSTFRKRIFQAMVVIFVLAIMGTVLYKIYFTFIPQEELTKKILAVLPFKNLGQPGDEYFADGLSDAIITELAKSPAIGIISITSAMQYKDSEKNIEEIGHELGADYLLMGTIQWNKGSKTDNIKISPKLASVKGNTYLWAETYEANLEKIFETQNEIAGEVSSALGIKFADEFNLNADNPPTLNIEAYDYYLKGNLYFNRGWEKNDLSIAIKMYEKATEIDPDFAIAYAMLSRAHACLYWDYYDRTGSRLVLARQAIDRALEINPNLPEAKLALGIYYYSQMEYEPALDLFLEVLRYQPNNIEAIAAVAGVYRHTGILEKAAEQYKLAFKLDPRSCIRAFDVGLTYGMMRKYPEAIKYLTQANDLTPDWPMAYILKAWLYLFWKGDIIEASEVLKSASAKANLEQSEYYWWLLRIVENDYQKAIAETRLKTDTTSYYLQLARLYRLSNQDELQKIYSDSARSILESKVSNEPENARFQSQLGLAYAGLGNKELAIEHGLKAISIIPPSKEAIYSLFFLANLGEIYVLVGQPDKAIDQLEYSMRIPGFISAPYLKLDPVWRSLQDNPRFQKLLDENK